MTCSPTFSSCKYNHMIDVCVVNAVSMMFIYGSIFLHLYLLLDFYTFLIFPLSLWTVLRSQFEVKTYFQPLLLPSNKTFQINRFKYGVSQIQILIMWHECDGLFIEFDWIKRLVKTFSTKDETSLGLWSHSTTYAVTYIDSTSIKTLTRKIWVCSGGLHDLMENRLIPLFLSY